MSIFRRNPKRDENERLIAGELLRRGATVLHLSQRGLPDLLIGYRGRLALVEVKNPGGRDKLTIDQQAFFRMARSLDWPAYICRDSEDVRLALTDLGAR